MRERDVKAKDRRQALVQGVICSSQKGGIVNKRLCCSFGLVAVLCVRIICIKRKTSRKGLTVSLFDADPQYSSEKPFDSECLLRDLISRSIDQNFTKLKLEDMAYSSIRSRKVKRCMIACIALSAERAMARRSGGAAGVIAIERRLQRPPSRPSAMMQRHLMERLRAQTLGPRIARQHGLPRDERAGRRKGRMNQGWMQWDAGQNSSICRR